ncbi:N-carbamoyl-L-amino-acid hydrolase [Streptomyces sp. WMMB 714]|nr:N-carbamoyl-L-amino-acid hydrolase [Streptomyces sp. WMMB 714]
MTSPQQHDESQDVQGASGGPAGRTGGGSVVGRPVPRLRDAAPAAEAEPRPPSFHEMWRDLASIGRDKGSGGYRRYAWTGADTDCRAWFRAQAESRGLAYELDRNGNQWAWLGVATPEDIALGNAVVTGSHLDSVPDGGAFDGPLGVVSAFAALDRLRAGHAAFTAPVGIVNFTDEEGARFGLACVGSRLSSGGLSQKKAHALTDADGTTLPQAMERAGHDPDAIGPDPERMARIGAFVELHIEQGRALADPAALARLGADTASTGTRGRPVGVASAIWPHGRWRFDFRGEANHAGTTRIEDRRDPMLTYAATVLAAREKALLTGALATFGKVAVEPNGVNAVPGLVRGWLDSRAADEDTLAAVVAAVEDAAAERGRRDGVQVDVTRESRTPVVEFAHDLRDRLAQRLDGAPLLPTGAGHDAGILSASVPTAMLYVRNPTGVSHSPAEFAEEDDCEAGVDALADVLEELACR